MFIRVGEGLKVYGVMVRFFAVLIIALNLSALGAVAQSQIEISPGNLGNAIYGTAYSESLSTSGGYGGYQYTVSSGALPSGLTLSTGGDIAGSPMSTGNFSFVVSVTDSGANLGQEFYTITVEPQSNLLVLNPTTIPDGSFGSPYTQAITASGGAGSNAFQITSGSLPAGLSMTEAGLIFGTPTETGAFSITVEGTDEQGNTGAGSYAFDIDPVTTLAITPPTLPEGHIGSAYSAALNASGGDGNYTGILTGSLPAGVIFEGSILAFSGAPFAAGSFPVQLTVTDGQNNTGVATFSLVINADIGTVFISTSSLTDATYNTFYSQTLSAAGGSAPYDYAIGSGALPSNITLSPGGTISGVAIETGNFSFRVDVEDAFGSTGSINYSLTVNPNPTGLTVLPAPIDLTVGTYRSAYNETFTATGGNGNNTFALTGSLPLGLNFTPVGILSGTPLETGTFNFDVVATDDLGNQGSTSYALEINPSSSVILVTPDSLSNATFASNYSASINITGGDGSYTVTHVAADLPPGLTFNPSTLRFSGIPTVVGTFPFSINVEDGLGNTTSKALSITVDADSFRPIPVITGAPANFDGQTSFSFTINYGETVSGFVQADVSVSNASLTSFVPSADSSSYAITVNTQALTDVTISVPANVAADLSGNLNVAALPVTVTNTAVDLIALEEQITAFIASKNANLIANQPSLLPGSRPAFSLDITSDAGRIYADSGRSVGPWFHLSSSWSTIGSITGSYSLLSAGTTLSKNESSVLGAMFQFDFSDQIDGVESYASHGWLIGPYITSRGNELLNFEARLLVGQSESDIVFARSSGSFGSNRLLAQFAAETELNWDSFSVFPNFSATYVIEQQKSYVDTLGNTIPSNIVENGELQFGLNFRHTLVSWNSETTAFGGVSGNIVTATQQPASQHLNLNLGLERKWGANATLQFEGYLNGIASGTHEIYGASISYHFPF